MVERFKQVRDGRLGWGLAPRSNGDLCRYSDYADLERQIAELRAKLDEYKEVAHNRTAAWTAAEAENARLRTLPLKDEVERVLERAQQKMRTYVGVYPGDKELRKLLSDWDALLSRLRAGEHVEIDPNELAFADLRASGGVFPEFYGPSSASDAELAQAHDDMDTHGVPRQERGHTMSLAARVYWLAKQRIDALRAGEQEGWRPIETAPKDGTPILAFREPSCIGTSSPLVFVAWCEESQEWIWPDDTYDPYVLDSYTEAYQAGSEYADTKFTYWMPLPAAPSEQGGDDNA